jgi:hypothetical protein
MLNGIPVILSSFITNSEWVNYTIEAADGTTVTNGTLQIDPGYLSGNIPVPASLQQPGTFFRVTLSAPVNGQLGAASRAYFTVESLPSDPLTLGLAHYPDERLVYWTDSTATVLEPTNVAGPWATLSSAVCPVWIPGAQTTEYSRLKR